MLISICLTPDKPLRALRHQLVLPQLLPKGTLKMFKNKNSLGPLLAQKFLMKTN